MVFLYTIFLSFTVYKVWCLLLRILFFKLVVYICETGQHSRVGGVMLFLCTFN